MALKYAVASGNWSSTSTWNGSTLPTSADNVYANGFTVAIDQDITVATISTGASSPAVAGGGFTVSHGSGNRTITANMTANTTTCITMTGNGTITYNGNIVAGSSANSAGITFTNNNPSLTVVGDVTGSSTTSTGAGIGGTVPNVTVTGNIYGIAGPAISLSTTLSSLTINGNVTGGTAGGSAVIHGITTSSAATITINGNVYGGTQSTCYGLNASGGATVTVTGLCKGGSGSNAHGLFASSSAAVIDLQGQVEAGSGGAGAYLIGPTSVRAAGPFIHHSGTSRAPIVATHFAVKAGQNTTWTVRNDTSYPAGTAVTLTNYVSNSPAPSNVRRGTTYGSGSSLTGTLDMPSAVNVKSGVSVDNTTGTAALSIPDVANIVGAEISAAVNQ